jgi:hypothetical protein
MSFALATPITDFQRQHRRNVETGCRGGTEGGKALTTEECCIAPRCRVEPYLIKATPAAPLARRQRRALPPKARAAHAGPLRRADRLRRLTCHADWPSTVRSCSLPPGSMPPVTLPGQSAQPNLPTPGRRLDGCGCNY